jgi:uncharacterized membrane protein
MEKRSISRTRYNFLKQELDYYYTDDIITDEQRQRILDLYEAGHSFNFIRVFLVVGAVLLGLGILSFIASNWDQIGKLFKFMIILSIFIAINYAGYRLKDKYPATGRSLMYVGVVAYGAGIFLIGQMFNYGGHFTGAFLLWAVGIIPMAVVLKDKIIYTFVHILILVYLNGHFSLYSLPLAMVLLIPVLYYLNRFFNYSKLITFLNNLVILNTIVYGADKYNLEAMTTSLVFLIIGLIMYFAPIDFNRSIFKIQGSLVFGIAGLVLTIPDTWDALSIDHSALVAVSVVFAIAYLVFLLGLTRKGDLIAFVFICLTIFRYYFDTFYDFMPKSLFFIAGGLLLLGAGYYFEKLRKRGGGIASEK